MSAGCFDADIGQTLNPSKNVMKNRTLATAVAVIGLFDSVLRANGLVLSNEPVLRAVTVERPPKNVAEFGDYSADLLASEPTEPLLYRTLSGATGMVLPPSIVSQPSNQSATVGQTVTLSVRATSGSGTLSYLWRKDGVPIKGANSSSYQFVASSVDASGGYDCVVRNSVYSAWSDVAVVTVRIPPNIVSQPGGVAVNAGGAVTLSISATGTGTVHYQWRLGGKNIPAATASQYAFKALGSGVYDCVVTDSVSSVTSTPATVSVLGGTFHGLIERNPTLNGNLASRIEVTTTASGACSLKITSGGLSTSVTGQLATGKTSQAVLELPVAKVGTLALVMDASGNKLTGTLKNAGGTSSASVSAWRNPWAQTAGNAAKVKGPYTFYFEQADKSLSLPQGYGHASFVVNGTTGNLTVVGSLADGSAISASTFVGKDGQILLYAPLYANRGSVAGTLSVTQGVSAPQNNAVHGSATWFKPASVPSAKDTFYPSGFGPIPLNVSGGFYVAPLAGGRIMSLPVGGNNAALAFKLGGLQAEIDQLFTISNPSPSGLTNTASIPANANPNGVKLPTLTASSGLFAGEFTLSGTARLAPFSGRIVTSGGQTKGYGFFLLPKVPGAGETTATAPRLSGQVLLKPAGP